MLQGCAQCAVPLHDASTVNKEGSRVSAFHPGHLSGGIQSSSGVLQATPHIVGLVAQCTGTQSHWLSKSVNSFTFNLYDTFGRAVLNSLNKFTQRESNLVITRFTWKPCLPFSWYQQRLSSHLGRVQISRPTQSAGIKSPSVNFLCFFLILSHQQTTLSHMEDQFDTSCSSSDLLDIEVIPKTGSGFNAFSFGTFDFDFLKSP